jgi:site-specific recombinase XerD
MAIVTLPDGRHKADVWVGDKRKRKTFAKHEAAVAWIEELKRETMKERKARNKHKSVPTMGDMFEAKQTIEDQPWTEGSKPMANAKLVLDGMDWWELPVTHVTEKALSEAWEHFRAKRNSESTINRKKSSVRVLLNLALRRGYIDRIPEGLRPKSELNSGRVAYLKKHEEKELLDALRLFGQDELLDFCVVLLDTGARVNEALSIRRRDLHDGTVDIDTLKGGHYRRIELTDRAEKALWRLVESDFEGVTQNRLNAFWNTKIRPFLGREKDKDFVPHILRHTCCSRLVMGGMDLAKVQYWMGHKSLATTQRYIHLSPKAAAGGRDILSNLA